MTVDTERVLSGAAELLTRRPAASMDEVAKATGLSRATLHRQFGDRDGLVRNLEELGISRLSAVLDAARLEEGPPEAALRRLVDHVQPVAGFLAFLTTQNQLFEPGEWHQGWARIDERIGALFQRGQEQGSFRVDLTATWLTEALYALVTASAWAAQDGRIAARDASRMASELLLGGAHREATGGAAAPATDDDSRSNTP